MLSSIICVELYSSSSVGYGSHRGSLCPEFIHRQPYNTMIHIRQRFPGNKR